MTDDTTHPASELPTTRHRKGKWALIAAALAATAVAAAVFALSRRGLGGTRSSEGPSKPGTISPSVLRDVSAVSLPPPAVGEADRTKQYLADNGSLIAFRNAAAPLIAMPSNPTATSRLATCTAVATSLNSVVPSELLTAATGIPDPVLAELYVDVRRLTSDALVACGKGDDGRWKSAVDSLRNADALISRRSKEIGL